MDGSCRWHRKDLLNDVRSGGKDLSLGQLLQPFPIDLEVSKHRPPDVEQQIG